MSTTEKDLMARARKSSEEPSSLVSEPIEDLMALAEKPSEESSFAEGESTPDLENLSPKELIDFLKNQSLENLSHYAILGVAETASKEIIRKKYFALAQLAHPDRGKENLPIFQAITKAHESLVEKSTIFPDDQEENETNIAEEKEFTEFLASVGSDDLFVDDYNIDPIHKQVSIYHDPDQQYRERGLALIEQNYAPYMSPRKFKLLNPITQKEFAILLAKQEEAYQNLKFKSNNADPQEDIYDSIDLDSGHLQEDVQRRIISYCQRASLCEQSLNFLNKHILNANSIAAITTDVVVPDSTDVVVPDSTDVIVPDSTDVVVPYLTDVVVPDLTDVVVPDSTDVVVPDLTDVVVPDLTDVVVPDSTDIVVPDSTDVVVPGLTGIVEQDFTQLSDLDGSELYLRGWLLIHGEESIKLGALQLFLHHPGPERRELATAVGRYQAEYPGNNLTSIFDYYDIGNKEKREADLTRLRNIDRKKFFLSYKEKYPDITLEEGSDYELASRFCKLCPSEILEKFVEELRKVPVSKDDNDWYQLGMQSIQDSTSGLTKSALSFLTPEAQRYVAIQLGKRTEGKWVSESLDELINYANNKRSAAEEGRKEIQAGRGSISASDFAKLTEAEKNLAAIEVGMELSLMPNLTATEPTYEKVKGYTEKSEEKDSSNILFYTASKSSTQPSFFKEVLPDEPQTTEPPPMKRRKMNGY